MEWEGRKPESSKQKQFREDMIEAGFAVQFYNGRHYYEGWATVIDDQDHLQDVVRATDVKLQWDDMGKGLVIYPRQ